MKRTFAFLILILCLSAFLLISCNGSDTTTTESATTYTITYELDGGTNSENNPSGYNSGVSLELGVPTKEGYMFAGWYTDPELTNFVTEIKKDATGDITLYAKWLDIETYLEFELVDGSYKVVGGCNPIPYMFIPSTYKGLPVTCIGESAFKSYVYLQYVYIPDSVTVINHSAFKNCQSLKEIRLSNNLTKISYSTFYSSGLESIVIPDKVEYIDLESFGDCKNLSYVKLSEELTTIKILAFRGCEVLESIVIPSKVTDIGTQAFYNCFLLKNIIVDDESTTYKSMEGVLYSKDGKTLIYYPEGKTETTYTIPEGTEIIAHDAFEANSRLVNVSFPNTVKQIQGAFGDCTALESIVIPDSVTSIGAYGFYGCTSLKSITLSKNIDVIHVYAFGECTSLESVVIPNGVKEIDSYVFYECTSLKSVVIPESVTVAEYDIFALCTSLEKVYCEVESKPDSWNGGWARNVKEVIWGYKGE